MDSAEPRPIRKRQYATAMETAGCWECVGDGGGGDGGKRSSETLRPKTSQDEGLARVSGERRAAASEENNGGIAAKVSRWVLQSRN